MSEQHQDTFLRHLRHTPQLNAETWRVIVDGLVAAPLTLKYNMLHDFPMTTTKQLLICAGHTPEEPLASVVTWRGVLLQELLQRTEPQEQALYISIHSADGYATSIPLKDAEDVLLAYEMNGESLTPEHGYPARLVVPGRYGYKQPKWLQHIIVSDTPVAGYWEQHGRDTVGLVPPTATHQQRTLTVKAGEPVALAGLTNGKQVEVRIDGGHWNPATVDDDLTWRTNWTPSLPGVFQLQVRAKDDDTIQPETTQPVITVKATL